MDKSVYNTWNMTYIVCIFGTYAIYTVKWLNKVDTKNYFYSKNNWTYMQVLYNFVSFKSLLSTRSHHFHIQKYCIKKFRKKELLFTSFHHSYLLNCSVHFQRKKKKIFNVHTTFIIQIKNYKANIDTNKELELSVQTF